MDKTLKKEKGVTLLALTIYMAVFIIIIAIVTTISTSFYGGIGELVDTPKYLSEFNQFVMFFVIDIKNYNDAVVSDDSITLNDSITYSYRNNCIYRNDVIIAENILQCNFSPSTYTVNNTEKNIINVDMKIGEDTEDCISRNIDFTLKYW